MITNKRRADDAFDHELRIHRIVDMASATATEAFHEGNLHDDLMDFVDHLENGAVHPSLNRLSSIFSSQKDEGSGFANAAQWAARLDFLGLAVEFTTPVRVYRSKGCFTSGFGYTRSIWVYANTFDEAWTLGVEWAEQSHKRDKEVRRDQ